MPADVILSVTGASAAPTTDIATAFRAAAPALATAPVREIAATSLPALAPRPGADAPEPHPAPGVYWNPTLRTNPSGVLTLTVQLPREPADLRALVWAAATERFGQARSTLSITRPFELQVEAPPLFRAGDVIELAARIENTSPITQEIQASLSFAGVRLLDDLSTPTRNCCRRGRRRAWPGACSCWMRPACA